MTTLVDILLDRAARESTQLAYTFVQGAEEERVRYGELWARAAGIAQQIDGATRPGDRVLLLHPSGAEFVAAFLGCLAAGRIPVPLAAPTGGRGEDRIALVANDCEAALTLTPANTTRELAPRWQPARLPRLDDIAFLQYTSGSTGTPRGVIVTHANLVANQTMIGHAFGSSRDDVGMGWLPLYHDMGLIGKALHPLFRGFPVVLMSPFAFLQQPLRWLRLISQHRATISGGPDFAFALCAKKATEAAVAELDLSSWRVAFTGAEPVRRATLATFARTFAPAGFREAAFLPCYGLAEATLIVSGGSDPRGAVDADVQGTTRIACGAAVPGVETRTVDPETLLPTPPGVPGEIWVRGPSVARGYWRNAPDAPTSFAAKLATGEGPYLRTGDLGALVEGELVVTGRLKDLVIVAGRNHYPHDLEATCEKTDERARAGASAAFSVDAASGEALVVMLELDREGLKAATTAHAERIDRLRVALAAEHGLTAHDIVLVRPGALPRTTSGKLRRSACRDLYERNELTALQVASLRGPAAQPHSPPAHAAAEDLT